jgi:hypothetical protein
MQKPTALEDDEEEPLGSGADATGELDGNGEAPLGWLLGSGGPRGRK